MWHDIKKYIIEKGSLDTMIDRLCKTMNAMDREWSKKLSLLCKVKSKHYQNF